MGQHIRWQAILTFTGIALTLAFLGFLSLSRRTITVPDTGGIYQEAVAGVPQFINPLLAQYNRVDQDLSALIFNGLTRADGKGGVEPDLAQSWEISDGGLAYLFQLQQGIRWQDNQPFTADDVLFTISLMQDPEFPGVPYLGNLWRTVSVQKLDDYTIRFTLLEPFPAFVDFTSIGILPQHLLKDMPARDLLNHPFNVNPVGTGPFKLDEITAEFAHLSANPLYTGAQPRLTDLEFRFYPSYQETITAYEEGEVKAIGLIPPQLMPELQDLNSLEMYTARLSGYNVIYLNLQNPVEAPFFTDPTVRQALLVALDRQALIDEALNGQGLVATGPILPWSWAYHPQQPLVDFDLAKAKGLLDAAGWVDSDEDGIREREGRPFTFTLLTTDDPDKIAVAEAVSKQWLQIGVVADIEIMGAGLGEQLTQHRFQAILAEISLSGDPDPYPLWHQTQIEGGQNYGGWSHEQASQLLEAARTITNTGRRNDFYFEFQQIFTEEVPALILFYPVYTYGVHQDVLGVQLGPLTKPSDRFRNIADWYLLTRQVIYSESQFPGEVRQGLQNP